MLCGIRGRNEHEHQTATALPASTTAQTRRIKADVAAAPTEEMQVHNMNRRIARKVNKRIAQGHRYRRSTAIRAGRGRFTWSAFRAGWMLQIAEGESYGPSPIGRLMAFEAQYAWAEYIEQLWWRIATSYLLAEPFATDYSFRSRDQFGTMPAGAAPVDVPAPSRPRLHHAEMPAAALATDQALVGPVRQIAEPH